MPSKIFIIFTFKLFLVNIFKYLSNELIWKLHLTTSKFNCVSFKFKIEDTAYKTYISNKIIDFNFFSIINFKLVNNIIIILKIIIKLRKVVNKNG